MKILQPGNNMGGQWAAEFSCTGHGNSGHGCGAVLEVQESDLYLTHSSSMGRHTTRYITFMCPCCGTETDIANDDGYRCENTPRRVWDFRLPTLRRSQVAAAQEHLKTHGVYKSPREFSGG